MHLPTVFDDIRQFGSYIFLAIAALWPIVDPLGGAPIYLSMTSTLTPKQRTEMARVVAIYSSLLLLASALVGAYVLDFFGVSIPCVQVAGGIVVCGIAWSLLNAPNASPAMAGKSSEVLERDVLRERAFYPMTMPLTVGPGSISVAITLGANPPQGLRSLFVTALAHSIGILIVGVTVYICYAYADRILKALGPIGTSVVLRLTAFILLCIGVQITWNGLQKLLKGILVA
jgi:multiple antibiotic resistance protein